MLDFLKEALLKLMLLKQYNLNSHNVKWLQQKFTSQFTDVSLIGIQYFASVLFFAV